MRRHDADRKDFEQTVVEVTRVTRVVAGGKRMRFRALVVIGDKKGSVGMAVKKGADVSEAVNKAVAGAKKHMLKIPITNGTIPHQVLAKFKACKVMLKPARPGTGVIAGGAVRAVAAAAGISDIVAKMFGSSNKINNINAVFSALRQLHTKENSKNLF
ncbi:MAG: 30S ribosomal protein S5 [Candidatus Doudnabacteria bacterium]|nr:30S ribosomal protein S5 [Candidatus Doudnabacteria bacterium]